MLFYPGAHLVLALTRKATAAECEDRRRQVGDHVLDRLVEDL